MSEEPPDNMNEAEFQANMVQRIKEAFPFLPSGITVERSLKLCLGHHKNIILKSNKGSSNKVGGRYDCAVWHQGRPLLLCEFKAPSINISEDDIQQGWSYASLHNPLIPLVAITNGNDTKLITTVSRKEVSNPGEMDLEVMIDNTAKVAKDVTGEAVRTLLGDSKEVWGQIFSDWNERIIDEITGSVSDFNLPIADRFQIPRETTHEVLKAIDGGQRVITIHGPPLSGVTNILVQITQLLNSPALFLQLSDFPDPLLCVADRLSQDLRHQFSKEDIRHWINMGTSLNTLTLVLDKNEFTQELGPELIDLVNLAADSNLVNIVLGMSTGEFERLSNKTRKTRFGRKTQPFSINSLSENEFDQALLGIGKEFGAGFYNGAKNVVELRSPAALRIAIDAVSDEAPVSDREKRLFPLTSPDSLRKFYSKHVPEDPRIKHLLKKLAQVFLSTTEENRCDIKWVKSTWGKASIKPEVLEESLASDEISLLLSEGIVAWASITPSESCYLCRLDEILGYEVAKIWADGLKLANDEELTGLLTKYQSLIQVIPQGDVILAESILLSSKEKPGILGPTIDYLIKSPPKISYLGEGSIVDLLSVGHNITLKFGEGMKEKSIGNLNPWVVLSHMIAYPIALIDDNSDPGFANPWIISVLADYSDLLIQHKPHQAGSPPMYHCHDIEGLGTFPCWTSGIIEPLTQSLLIFAGSHNGFLIQLAEHAKSNNKLMLIYRVMQVAKIMLTMTDECIAKEAADVSTLLNQEWKKIVGAHIESKF